MPAQAAAVTVFGIANPCCPALFLAADLLLLLPICPLAVLFPAVCRAVLCPAWGEPGSAGPETGSFAVLQWITTALQNVYVVFVTGRFFTAQVYSKHAK